MTFFSGLTTWTVGFCRGLASDVVTKNESEMSRLQMKGPESSIGFYSNIFLLLNIETVR